MDGRITKPGTSARFLWIAIACALVGGEARGEDNYELQWVADPETRMVPFSGEEKKWLDASGDWTCDIGTDPSKGATRAWATFNDYILEQLKEVIEKRRETVRLMPDGSPPDWWRDLLSVYTSLVSYTHFNDWPRYLRVIDKDYKLADKSVWCFTSGDRGGWVIDRAFQRKTGDGKFEGPAHVVFFSMGTNTAKQMDLNVKMSWWLPLEQVIKHYWYNFRWGYWLFGWENTHQWYAPRLYKDRFCPALVPLEAHQFKERQFLGRRNALDIFLREKSYVLSETIEPDSDVSYNYMFKNMESRRTDLSDVTISLAAVRAIRAACKAGSPIINPIHNPMLDFFKAIDGAHVTFAGHSRGGLGEGLAAFAALHAAGQRVESMRVVGLATPATTNLHEKSIARLPNGKKFERVVVQNLSSDLGGVGADQVPRFGSWWWIRDEFQWWNTGYGQQKITPLADWAGEVAGRKAVSQPMAPMTHRYAGSPVYLLAGYTGRRDYGSIAWPHWAGIYASAIIGEYHRETNWSKYFNYLRRLAVFQEFGIKNLQFRFVSWLFPVEWKQLSPAERKDVNFVRHRFLNASFTDADHGPAGNRDEFGDLWTVMYMSEAALAAAGGRVRAFGFEPFYNHYEEGLASGRFFSYRFTHIRGLALHCAVWRAGRLLEDCQRWEIPGMDFDQIDAFNKDDLIGWPRPAPQEQP